MRIAPPKSPIAERCSARITGYARADSRIAVKNAVFCNHRLSSAAGISISAQLNEAIKHPAKDHGKPKQDRKRADQPSRQRRMLRGCDGAMQCKVVADRRDETRDFDLKGCVVQITRRVGCK